MGSSITGLMHLTFLVLAHAQQIGFSAELIRRDSALSPSYTPKSRLQRWNEAVRRSHERASRQSYKPSMTRRRDGKLIPYNGDFLKNISLGTPPFAMLALADTAADLIWVQCVSCVGGRSNPSVPRFDPATSETYLKIDCHKDECAAFDNDAEYGDGSHSQGGVASDTRILGLMDGAAAAFNNAVIGCSISNESSFSDLEAGIIGLGPGRNSLIGQINESIAWVISHRLLPWEFTAEASSINFRSHAILSRPVVSTKIFAKPEAKGLIFLNLEAITVGNIRYDNPDYFFGERDGNIVIDSGATFSRLPFYYYNIIAKALNSSMVDAGAEPVPPPPDDDLTLCFRTIQGIRIPNATIHFEGASITLSRENIFVHLDDVRTACFAFLPIEDGYPVLGNVAQANFWVDFDVASNTVSFKPADCTSLLY